MFYTSLGVFYSLLLIPVLTLLFYLWSPRRGPQAGWRLAAVAGLAAALVASVAALLMGSSQSESIELLPPLFLVCWIAVLAGALFDRWESVAQPVVPADAPKAARR